MKRLRGIHLFFILFAAAVIICFWFGFHFGKETQYQLDLAKSSEEKLSKNEETVYESTKENGDLEISIETEETLEASSKYEVPKFYLKQNGEYVTVYVTATDEVYFETDIVVEDLPIELQEEMQYGIDFYDLNGVYTFLENYSS